VTQHSLATFPYPDWGKVGKSSFLFARLETIDFSPKQSQYAIRAIIGHDEEYEAIHMSRKDAWWRALPLSLMACKKMLWAIMPL
jgi:hypothetical protein